MASWATALPPTGRNRWSSRVRGKLAAALFLAACTDVTGPNPHHVADVVLTPDTASVIIGTTATLRAQPVGASGAAVNNLSLFWSSSDTSIATVSQTGVVTGVHLGKVSIDASTQGISPKHPAQVTVIPVPVASIVVAPSSVMLRIGSAFQFSDTTKDAARHVLTGRTVVWTSSDTTVAAIDQSGLVIARKPGAVTVSATFGAVVGTASVTVSLVPVSTIALAPSSPTVIVGQQTQISATTMDSAGNVLTGRPIAWFSRDTTIATIDKTGTVTGKKVASVTIGATSGGVTSTATLTVKPVPINTVLISPQSSNLLVGQTDTLTAEVTDNLGNAIPSATVTFASGATGVATVTALGPLTATVTAVGSGQAQITGTSGAKSGSATVNVALVPVGSVTVTPPVDSLTIGGTVQLAVTVKDSAGNTLTGRIVTWSSSNSAVASVSAAGLVAGVSAGTVAIFATSGGKVGPATVTVKPIPVGSVTIAPKGDTLTAGAQTQLTVTVKDSLGNLIANPAVTWTSTVTGTAVVSGTSTTGLVTGVTPGTAQIIAQSGSRADTNTTLVIPAQTASVTVTPNPVTVTVGQAVVLTATQKDAGGNVLPGRTATWVSSNTSAAAITSSGVNGSGLDTAVVSGVAVGGPVTITATSTNNVTGTTQLTVSDVPVAYVVLTPNQFTVDVRFTRQVTAKAYDAGNNPLAGRQFTWTTKSGGSFATVDQTGLVTGVAAGPDSVFATSGGKTGGGGITVSLAPVSTVIVVPATATITAAQTLQLSDTLKDSQGDTLQRAVTWSSSNPGVATVSSTGLVQPVGGLNDSGTVTITVKSGTASGTATVMITQDPVATVAVTPGTSTITAVQTQSLGVALADASGAPLTGRPVAWSSSNTAIATVSTNGLVSPSGGLNDTGTVTITATSGSASGTATVTINPDPVASITVTPGTSTIIATQTQQLAATLKDAGGTTLTGRTPTWSTSDPTIATVSNNGVVTPTGLNDTGTVTITATSGSASGTATVTINPDPVASVTVTPGTSTIAATQTQQLAATLKDAGGTTLTGRTPTWSTSNTALATVSSTGLVSPTGLNDTGTVTITATSGSASGTATVTINPDPVASVTVAPGTSTILATQTQQLAATLKDAGGTTLTGRTPTWSSSNTAIATVSNTGLVSPTGLNDTGTVTITATSGSASGTATVNINPDPVASITVTPGSSTITTAGSQQLTANLFDAINNPLTRTVTWSSSNTALANVSSSGLVTPFGTVNDTGSVTIMAAVGAVNGTATIRVTNVPVTSVSVAPTSSMIYASAPNNTQQLIATTTPAGEPVTWSVTGGTVVGVSASGLVTGNGSAAGTATVTATSANSPANGSASVTVIGHIQTVTPNVVLTTLSVSTAQTTTATATLTDQFLTDVSAQRAVTWSSSDPGTTVSPTVGNPANSTVTITATAVPAVGNSVTITATADDGTPGSVVITVNP